MATSLRLILFIFAGAFAGGSLSALDWPVWPDSSWHRVSAAYGHLQSMPDGLFLHTAIDIAAENATPVYSAEGGFVKAVFTIFGSDRHWRIVIADSAGEAECDGWLYAHVVRFSIPVEVGQWVDAGDSLGCLVGDWPYPTTPAHLHFSKIRFAGDSTAWANGFYDYEVMGNPLEFLDSVVDPDFPFFENDGQNQLFAFYRNESDIRFPESEAIDGPVDIVCRALDNCYFYSFATNPYQLEYKIEGDSFIPWTTSVLFNEPIGSYNGFMATYRSIIYKTHGYDPQEPSYLRFVLTNTDGDSVVEVSDSELCWNTPYFHNGEYIVYARATDFVGNSTVDSMTVRVTNAFELSGTVTLEGSASDLSGTIIVTSPDGGADVTDSAGRYIIPNVGGGVQLITVTKPGFGKYDTAFVMIADSQLDILLNLDYVCGDADISGSVNLLDVTFIINYLYKEGLAPVPPEGADADGNGSMNILDVTHIINYLYKEGPEPICPEV